MHITDLYGNIVPIMEGITFGAWYVPGITVSGVF
jgi:hypothetical protein